MNNQKSFTVAGNIRKKLVCKLAIALFSRKQKEILRIFSNVRHSRYNEIN